MGKRNNKIQTSNGTTIGLRAKTSDGRPAMRVKSRHHEDIITAEQTVELITGKRVQKIIYGDTSAG